MNRVPFSVDEWYHCYNRGVDKRTIFETAGDYDRFSTLLFTSNSDRPIHLSNFRLPNLKAILNHPDTNRGNPLVEVGAYCLMPNHIHLLLREVEEGGIARFMQKVGTGYTMYFNKKYERTGALFAGTFKSKHILDDLYLKKVVPYIHLNPVDLDRTSIRKAREYLSKFKYSSFQDFITRGRRPESNILGETIFELFDHIPSLQEQLDEAREYSADSTLRQG